MTKNDIIADIMRTAGITSRQAADALRQCFRSIAAAAERGHSTFIRGFGSFRIVHRKARSCNNLRGNRGAIIPAHNTIKLIISKALRIGDPALRNKSHTEHD